VDASSFYITKTGNIWRDLVIAARLVRVYQAF
jgi:hypothetical protein